MYLELFESQTYGGSFLSAVAHEKKAKTTAITRKIILNFLTQFKIIISPGNN